MAEEVGGQLQAMPARQSLFGPDYLRLGSLVLVAAAIHVWLVVHTAVPARDSLGYARIALNISDPHEGPDEKWAAEQKERETQLGFWRAAEVAALLEPKPPCQRIDVIRKAEQPPGYPLAVWGTEKILRQVTHLTLADRSLLATQVANAFAAVLLVIPMYLTGRILFGRNVGFAAALLFQVLPVPARVTSDGLSEGVYLLVVGVAIMLAVRAARKPGIGGFLLCGLATGASYLVRPEGLMVALAAGCVIIASGLARRWPRDAALGRLAALGVGVALAATPYMLLTGKFTTKPTGDYLTNPFNTQPARIWIGQPGAKLGTGGTAPLFAAWWDPERDAGRNRFIWAIEAVWSETFKSLHYIVGLLAIVALIAHRRQLFAPDPGMWLLVILGAINLLLLLYLAVKMGYVSERHTVLFTMIACHFAASSFEPVAHFIENVPRMGRLIIWPRAAPATLFVALVLSALPYTLKPMHAQREGHKYAGLWLADHMGVDDHLVDPLTWAEWYAGRTLYRTVTYHGHPEVTWVIIESGKNSPHSRLPQWERAKQLAEQGTLAHRWPADDGTAVEVYRVTREQQRLAKGK